MVRETKHRIRCGNTGNSFAGRRSLPISDYKGFDGEAKMKPGNRIEKNGILYNVHHPINPESYVTELDHPKSAFAYVGCFGFYAGEPEKELVLNKPDGFVIMIPQNEAWAKLIEECFKSTKRVARYAIKKNTIFNEELLRRNVSMLPAGYELKKIDPDIYDKCLDSPVTADFVSAYALL